MLLTSCNSSHVSCLCFSHTQAPITGPLQHFSLWPPTMTRRILPDRPQSAPAQKLIGYRIHVYQPTAPDTTTPSRSLWFSELSCGLSGFPILPRLNFVSHCLQKVKTRASQLCRLRCWKSPLLGLLTCARIQENTLKPTTSTRRCSGIKIGLLDDPERFYFFIF